jgi:8-oxo-dGTP pyrophosphatase MutT (NUDIX family)
VGDGNGWTTCALGHRHWGLFGAAGLLLTDGERVLLQHRAPWTHEGGTWAVPGGARDSHESPIAAAKREAAEETDLDPGSIVALAEWVDEHGGWSYTTIVARTSATGAITHTSPESTEVRWWPIDSVATLPLHHGFAAAWPVLRGLLDGRISPAHDG